MIIRFMTDEEIMLSDADFRWMTESASILAMNVTSSTISHNKATAWFEEAIMLGMKRVEDRKISLPHAVKEILRRTEKPLAISRVPHRRTSDGMLVAYFIETSSEGKIKTEIECAGCGTIRPEGSIRECSCFGGEAALAYTALDEQNRLKFLYDKTADEPTIKDERPLQLVCANGHKLEVGDPVSYEVPWGHDVFGPGFHGTGHIIEIDHPNARCVVVERSGDKRYVPNGCLWKVNANEANAADGHEAAAEKGLLINEFVRCEDGVGGVLDGRVARIDYLGVQCDILDTAGNIYRVPIKNVQRIAKPSAGYPVPGTTSTFGMDSVFINGWVGPAIGLNIPIPIGQKINSYVKYVEAVPSAEDIRKSIENARRELAVMTNNACRVDCVVFTRAEADKIEQHNLDLYKATGINAPTVGPWTYMGFPMRVAFDRQAVRIMAAELAGTGKNVVTTEGVVEARLTKDDWSPTADFGPRYRENVMRGFYATWKDEQDKKGLAAAANGDVAKPSGYPPIVGWIKGYSNACGPKPDGTFGCLPTASVADARIVEVDEPAIVEPECDTPFTIEANNG